MYEVSFREETIFFMDVLGSSGNVLRNGSAAQNTKGYIERALRAILSAVSAFLGVPSTLELLSVSITAASRRNRNERFQHIRSFEFAFARGRCRSEFTAHATRAVRP